MGDDLIADQDHLEQDEEEKEINPLHLKKLSDKHKFIAILIAQGYSQRSIAREMNYTESRISLIVNSPIFQEEVQKHRELMFDELTLDSNFKRIAPVAARVAEDIMLDGGARQSLKADIAFKFLDRALGKPKQQIEHTGSVLREMLEILQKEENKKTIDVTPEEKDMVEAELVSPSTASTKEEKDSEDASMSSESSSDMQKWVEDNLDD